MKTWALAALASIPITWSLLAASDSVLVLVVHSVILLAAFNVGYFLNRDFVPAAVPISIGLPIALLTPALALSSDGVYGIVLVTIFEVGVGLIAVGLGSLARRTASRLGPAWPGRERV